jgi:hypothetical protein
LNIHNNLPTSPFFASRKLVLTFSHNGTSRSIKSAVYVFCSTRHHLVQLPLEIHHHRPRTTPRQETRSHQHYPRSLPATKSPCAKSKSFGFTASALGQGILNARGGTAKRVGRKYTTIPSSTQPPTAAALKTTLARVAGPALMRQARIEKTSTSTLKSVPNVRADWPELSSSSAWSRDGTLKRKVCQICVPFFRLGVRPRGFVCLPRPPAPLFPASPRCPDWGRNN